MTFSKAAPLVVMESVSPNGEIVTTLTDDCSIQDMRLKELGSSCSKVEAAVIRN